MQHSSENPKMVGETRRSEAVPRIEVKSDVIFEFEEGTIRGKWLKLQSELGTVEGGWYEPEQSNGEMVLVITGLPGPTAGLGWFEREHIKKLLSEGYEVYVIHHQGQTDFTGSLNIKNRSPGEVSPDVVSHEVSANAWLKEPETALLAFQKPMTVVSHSFGGLFAAHAFSELQKRYGEQESNPLHRLKKWLMLSGVTINFQENGELDPAVGSSLETWKAFFRSMRDKGIFSIPNPDQSANILLEALKSIGREIPKLPLNVSVVGVYPEEDKIVSIKGGFDLQKLLGRGVLIKDKTYRSNIFDPLGKDAHNFPHMTSETLVRLMRLRTSKYPHLFTLHSPVSQKK